MCTEKENFIFACNSTFWWEFLTILHEKEGEEIQYIEYVREVDPRGQQIYNHGAGLHRWNEKGATNNLISDLHSCFCQMGPALQCHNGIV